MLFRSLACLLPPLDGLPWGAYLGIGLLLAGGVLLLPSLAALLARRWPAGRSIVGRLAAARLTAAPGNAVVAAAGVLASVALASAMAIMVASFRQSVDQWLGEILPADLYIRSAPMISGSSLDEAMQAQLAGVPGIADIRFSRLDSLRLEPGAPPVAIVARRIPPDGSGLPLVGNVSAVEGPAVWISEAMQDLYGWQPGRLVRFPLGGRVVELPVAGVLRDYVRQTGSIWLDLADYRRLTGDRLANDAAIRLAPGANAEAVSAALLALSTPGSLEVSRPGDIRAQSLRIFDRTFAVTYALEAVAVAIGLG